MAKLEDIMNELIGFFPKGSLNCTEREYGFRFDYDRDINKIAYATNLTEEVIERAYEMGAQLLITHHDAWAYLMEYRTRCESLLQDYKINHCYFHTPLDGATFGTSATLAKELGIENTKQVSGDPEGRDKFLYGVVGDIAPVSYDKFLKRVEKVIGAKALRAIKNHSSDIERVMVLTGGGAKTDFLEQAMEEGFDTYVTGEYSMYLQHYSQFYKINVISAGHTRTEFFGVRSLAEKLRERFSGIEINGLEEENF